MGRSQINDTYKRDFKWFESIWKRTLITNNSETYIRHFSLLSANLPDFQRKFPDAKIYIIRDPLNVLPSGLSLVTGVLDKNLIFGSLIQKLDLIYKRLYNALVELLNRFHYDWINENIDKKNVYIVHYDKMMNDFESLMGDIIKFLGLSDSESLKKLLPKHQQKEKL